MQHLQQHSDPWRCQVLDHACQKQQAASHRWGFSCIKETYKALRQHQAKILRFDSV